MSRKEEFNSFWFGERLSPSANACINSFRAHWFQFHLYMYDSVEDVPDFVDKRDAEDILPKAKVFFAHDGIEHFSDLFRYQLLRQLGGWWVDTDVVCNVDYLPETEVAFASDIEGTVSNAILKFPRNHPVIIDVLEEIANVDVESIWGSTGPHVLTKVINKNRDAKNLQWDYSEFHPIFWMDALKFHLPEFTDEVKEKTADSKLIHLYSHIFRQLGFDEKRFKPLEGSYLDLIYKRYADQSVISRLAPINEGVFRDSVKKYVDQDWFQQKLLERGMPSRLKKRAVPPGLRALVSKSVRRLLPWIPYGRRN
jgi:hypothetical protein